MGPWPFRTESRQASILGSAQETLRILQEVGLASTARGVETIGKLTRKGVDVASRGVSIVPVAALPLMLQRHSGAAVVATMRLEKDANGWGLLFLERADAMRLVDLMLQKPIGSTTQFASLEESTLGEAANIALNAMVAVVAQRAGASIRTNAPETSFDVKARVAGVAKPPAGEDHVVLVETSFTEKGAGVNGTMVLAFFTRAPAAR